MSEEHLETVFDDEVHSDGRERPKRNHCVIVIGASAGGIEPLKRIVRDLPRPTP